MTFKEAEEYLLDRLPMFQRQGATAFKKDLGNIRKLCAKLGDPQNSYKAIHIAGTNGKGSTAHMLASILQASGYKTGLYTSPHLKSYTERIRIDGQSISEEAVAGFVTDLQPAIEEINPSFFEVSVAMAFWYFQAEQVDYAVVETGMGGRLDSTNIITPILSVITTIGFDHQAFLGDTLPLIAAEKAGIIKLGVPVVVGLNEEEVYPVFESKAKELSSSYVKASDQWTLMAKGQGRFNAKNKAGESYELDLDLLGDYQINNLTLVLSCVEVLLGLGLKLEWLNIIFALGKVVDSTQLKGRFQVLGQDPMIVADTAHNEMGLKALIRQIKSMNKAVFAVVGVTKEKKELFSKGIWPKDWNYYFCTPDNPRCVEANELLNFAVAQGYSEVQSFDTVEQAYNMAKENSPANAVVLITGSTFTVSEIEGL